MHHGLNGFLFLREGVYRCSSHWQGKLVSCCLRVRKFFLVIPFTKHSEEMRRPKYQRLLFDVSKAAALKNETECVSYLQKVRWSSGIQCPRCQTQEELKELREFARQIIPATLFLCTCRCQFTVTSGTIFERSHLPLTQWFSAIQAVFYQPEMTVEALQSRIKTTYKTAWAVRGVVRNISEFELLHPWLMRLRHPSDPRRQRRWIHPYSFETASQLRPSPSSERVIELLGHEPFAL
jgi:hypothetical protein